MMDNLFLQLKKLRDRIDALSLRERMLIFVSVMVVLYVIAVNIIFAPLRADQTKIEKELAGKREQILALNEKIGNLAGKEGQDLDAENRGRLAELEARLRELARNLDEMTTGFVTPQEMARLVEQILVKNGNLEVLKVENLKPVPIGDQPAGAEGAGAAAEQIIFKHGLRIELRGRYFDIVNYLKALEDLRWKVFWGEVGLETEKYPFSRLSLVIYTLNRQKGWIGI